MVIDNNVSLLVFLAVGLVIPFLVDLVTNELASGALKQTVFLALSLVSGVLVEFLNALNSGVAFDWKTAGYGAIVAFISGVATFKGLDKTRALGKDSVINTAVPGGLGKPQDDAEDGV